MTLTNDQLFDRNNLFPVVVKVLQVLEQELKEPGQAYLVLHVAQDFIKEDFEPRREHYRDRLKTLLSLFQYELKA